MTKGFWDVVEESGFAVFYIELEGFGAVVETDEADAVVGRVFDKFYFAGNSVLNCG